MEFTLSEYHENLRAALADPGILGVYAYQDAQLDGAMRTVIQSPSRLASTGWDHRPDWHPLAGFSFTGGLWGDFFKGSQNAIGIYCRLALSAVTL